MNSADLMIQCLKAHGVQYIFGIPWEENLDILEAIRTSDIKLIVTRNEQSAVFMAATYGRLTGKAGVALATLGPGATNMMTGIAYAQLGGMPILVITGQKPIRQSKQAKFQIIDVVGMMKPITKFSTSIVDGTRIPSLVAQAFMIAEEERPGSVHLELPEDIAGMEVPEKCSPIIYNKIRRPIPDEKTIKLLIKKIEQSKTPMILIGAWSNRKRISNYLTQFIQKYNIPFFCSQMGKGVVNEHLKQYIRTAALTSNDYIHEVIAAADLIIAIGHDTIEKPTHILDSNQTEILHINFFPAEFDELYKPSLQIIGDIGHIMRELSEVNLDTSNFSFEKVYEKAWEAKEKILVEGTFHDIIQPQKFIRDIRSVLWEQDIVALDNGLYKVRFARNYPCYHPNTLLLDNALATMWAWYCSAIVAKILNPEHQVVAVVGDGGLMMNLWDLETAVRLGIELTIIVLNDNAYGMIKRKQKNHGYESFGLDLQNPDFLKLAESFGISGYRLDHPKNFESLLKKILKEPWVKIMEVPFQYPPDIT